MNGLRYVVLHHTGVAGPHFDLMFETAPESLLTTLRCPRWPVEVADVLEELPEHRRAYLEYEGPVSRDRGFVRRVEQGVCVITDLSVDPAVFALRLLSRESPSRREITLTHSFHPASAVSEWSVVQNAG